MRAYQSILIILFFGLLQACAPSRFVEPLKHNENAVSLSAGGAVFKNLGFPIPVPLSSITYGRGLRPKLTTFASMHITSLAYKTPMFEIGALYGIRAYNKYDKAYLPGLSVTPMANFAFSFRGGGAKLWPQLDLNAYWNVFDRNDLVYVGLSNWFELSQTRAFNEVQEHAWIWSPQVGYSLRLGKYSANLEVKLIGLDKSNQNITVDYIKPFGDQGTMGVFLGVNRRF